MNALNVNELNKHYMLGFFVFFVLFSFFVAMLERSSSSLDSFKHTGQWDGSLEANQNISLYANLKCSIRSFFQTTKTNNSSWKVQSHNLHLNLICWIDWTSGSVPATPLRVVLGESLNRGIVDRAALCWCRQGRLLRQQLNQSAY